jgi:hypothetical protein
MARICKNYEEINIEISLDILLKSLPLGIEKVKMSNI